uniref:FluG protein n=1 Tax=Coccidioides posadasii RMSCC 3488 TaxID=454284 RepID=A0A0J6F7S0_COCPO|nr:fluG protein [Coccidioides posadasii RMSCC 3488]
MSCCVTLAGEGEADFATWELHIHGECGYPAAEFLVVHPVTSDYPPKKHDRGRTALRPGDRKMADLQDLRCLIYSHPIIDNHAHNILRKDTATDYARYPLEAVTSEAQGEALIDHATKTLAHHRAVNQLAGLYGCEPEWESIKAARQKVVENEYNGLVKRCLEGTHTLLIDDGLTDGREVEVFSWHDAFTSSPTKTLVRIEAVAAKQMEKHVQDLRNRVPPITIQTVQIDHFFSYPDFREGFVKAHTRFAR